QLTAIVDDQNFNFGIVGSMDQAIDTPVKQISAITSWNDKGNQGGWVRNGANNAGPLRKDRMRFHFARFVPPIKMVADCAKCGIRTLRQLPLRKRGSI